MKFLFVFFTILLVGCQQNVTYTQYVSLPQGWHKLQPISFGIEENDTISKKNIFVMIRNNEEYDFSNLFIITNLHFPSGKTIVDTLEYEMATPEGKWLGYGYSSVKESKLWYKENFVFSEKGKYTIKVEQAMRKVGENQSITNLKGITEIGIQVENTQQ